MPDAISSHSIHRGHPGQPQEQPSPGHHGTTEGDRLIICLKCQQPGPQTHRFCRQCGSVLWKSCPQCGRERPIDESFCAACGSNIATVERQLLEKETARLAEARGQIERLELRDAIRTLHYLVRQDHPCLEKIRVAARELLPQAEAQRTEFEQRSQICAGRARVLLSDRNYRAVLTELQQIPEQLRDREAQELVQEATDALREIETLRQFVHESRGVEMADRVGAVVRLAELQGDDAQVKRWRTQIHDQILEGARQKLKIRRYQEAVRLLQTLPPALQSDDSQKLSRLAAELTYLESEMHLAPKVNSVTLESLKRLVRIDAGHQEAREKLREMTERLRRAGKSTAPVQWVPCPDTTHVGMSVHDVPFPARLQFASSQVQARFARHSAQYLVACGLAMQSMGRVAVPTSLVPPDHHGVLGRLRTGLRARPAKTGWGLDLGNSGLKAVQLSVNDQNALVVQKCLYIPHRTHLSFAEDARVARAVLKDSLKSLKSQHEIESDVPLVTQWPGLQSLVRMLVVPQVDKKRKMRDMIEHEAQHQIPFPLSEVCWDTHELQRDYNAGGRQFVLLIAAKRKDVEARLELLQEAGLTVQDVQSDAIALHNHLHEELFHDTVEHASAEASRAASGVAVLDIGSDVTNIILSGPELVFFRSVRPASDDLANAITRRFRVTRDVAQQVLRNPGKVKRMSDLHEESCEVMFSKLVSQFESAAGELSKLSAQVDFQQLLLAGGGSHTHGLLRYLRFGR